MFWSRGNSRQRKAVLSALSAVGETGMTLLALGVAVNIPEGRLHTILEGLVGSGQVRRRGASTSTVPGPRNAHYHLATARHSAVRGIPPRRTPAEPGPGTTRPGPAVRERTIAVERSGQSPLSRRAGAVSPAAVVRPGGAHGI